MAKRDRDVKAESVDDGSDHEEIVSWIRKFESFALASDYAPRLIVVEMDANSKQKSEFIPAAIIVRFVDTYTTHEQADDKCDGSNKSVPKTSQKSSRPGTWEFIFRF